MTPPAAFERQFQWEVDRWVFRRGHRGEPVEVTESEREALIALHRRRLAIWHWAALVIDAVASLILGIWIDWGVALVAIPLFYFLAAAATMPFFLWWAHADVTAVLKRRAPIGMPLGRTGQAARKASSFSLLELAGSFVVSIVASVACVALLLAGQDGGQPVLAFVYCVPVWIATVALGRMTVLKWAQRERERTQESKMKTIRRARNLR